MDVQLLKHMRKPYAIIKKEFLTAISYRFEFVSRLFGIWMSIFVYFFLSKLIDPTFSKALQPYGGGYFLFVVIGTAFSGYLGVGLDSFSTSIREAQLMGTLEAVLVTRTRFTTVLVYQALWNFLFASIAIFLYIGFALLFLNVPLKNANWAAALLILVLTIFVFSAIGIISGSFVLLFKRGTPVNWFIDNVSRFMGGVFYPISVLPLWCQKLSFLLPITHSLEGIRLALLRGYSLGELKTEVFALIIFAVLLSPLSVVCFNAAYNKARRDGTLCQY